MEINLRYIRGQLFLPWRASFANITEYCRMLNTIKGLIGEGKTQEAISQMSRLASGNNDIKNGVMQLSGQKTLMLYLYRPLNRHPTLC